ncbi:MAG: type I glyceraldehyde-3-phosphate dehydrogenase [Firmicutes bacterium]|nr:type I glyceraldehyde-3-phosphate dehydrogenase [Bacillota bacterium]
MAIKIGINGFGRIAIAVTRAIFEQEKDFEIVGINIRKAEFDHMAYLLKYDSVFGRFSKSVETWEKGLVIDGKKIPVFSENDPSTIPWGEVGAEYIVESTGAFLTKETAGKHIESGAKKVVLSAPAKDKDIPTFVIGVNNETYTTDMDIVSNASCTTNCLAPMALVLEKNFGITEGLISTIHAATSKQTVVDKRNTKDWRIGRSTFGNIIPSTTGAAKAVGLVIPELQGKLTGISFRVPSADGSVVDLTVRLEKKTSYEEICEKMKEASETYLKGVLRCSYDPMVSVDVIGDPHTSVFDATMGVQLNENFFKLISWYDNEWGYSTKLLALIRHMYSVDHK